MSWLLLRLVISMRGLNMKYVQMFIAGRCRSVGIAAMLRVGVVESRDFVTDGSMGNSIRHPIQTSSASRAASYPMNNERLYIPGYKVADFGQKSFLFNICGSVHHA